MTTRFGVRRESIYDCGFGLRIMPGALNALCPDWREPNTDEEQKSRLAHLFASRSLI
jgi:hypothetical protein